MEKELVQAHILPHFYEEGNLGSTEGFEKTFNEWWYVTGEDDDDQYRYPEAICIAVEGERSLIEVFLTPTALRAMLEEFEQKGKE